MNIIPAGSRHISEISKTESRCFSDPWSESSLSSALSDAFGIFLAAEENSFVKGYIIGSCDGISGYIEKVAVSPENRRKGIGKALLDAFEKNLPQTAESISLEVRASNRPAIAMYEHQGFSQAGIRKNFYACPKEDGIVMIKVII